MDEGVGDSAPEERDKEQVSCVSDAPAVRGGGKGPSGGKQPEKRTGPVTFYRQVVAELRKVVWPSRDQLVTYFFVCWPSCW